MGEEGGGEGGEEVGVRGGGRRGSGGRTLTGAVDDHLVNDEVSLFNVEHDVEFADRLKVLVQGLDDCGEREERERERRGGAGRGRVSERSATRRTQRDERTHGRG